MLVAIFAFTIMFSGCIGIITGHEYKKEDLVIVYKVVKNGVTTFMTPEEIKEAELDKVNIFVTDSYKLLTPQELEQEKGIQTKWACKGRMKLYSSDQDFNDLEDYKDFFDSFVLNNQNDNYDQINNQNLNRSSITFGIYCYWW